MKKTWSLWNEVLMRRKKNDNSPLVVGLSSPGDDKLESVTITVGNSATHEKIRQLLGHRVRRDMHMEAHHWK